MYPSLRTKSIPSPCTYDFYQDPSVKPHKRNDHPYKTHGATIDTACFFDQECPLFPSELASLSCTAIEQSSALSLSPPLKSLSSLHQPALHPLIALQFLIAH